MLKLKEILKNMLVALGLTYSVNFVQNLMKSL